MADGALSVAAAGTSPYNRPTDARRIRVLACGFHMALDESTVFRNS